MAAKLSRWDQIKAYVLRRLRAEVEAAGRRGYQAELCAKLGISSAHVSNMVTAGTRGVGIDVATKLASHWGMTLAELERVACGDAPDASPPLPSDQLDDLRQSLNQDMRRLLDERLRPAPRKRKSGEHPATAPGPVKKRAAPQKR